MLLKDTTWANASQGGHHPNALAKIRMASGQLSFEYSDWHVEDTHYKVSNRPQQIVC